MKRFLLIFMCLSILIGATACNDTASDETAGVTETGTDTQIQTTVEILPAQYEDIIRKYKELIAKKHSGAELSKNGDSSVILDVIYDIVENCDYPQLMGYSVKDIDKNGTDELILMKKDCTLYGLFTLVDDKPVLLARLSEDSAIDESGIVLEMEEADDGNFRIRAEQIVDGKLEELEYGNLASDEDDTETEFNFLGRRFVITEEQRTVLNNKYMYFIDNTAYLTKKAGLRFIPALEDSAQFAAPAVDFSSYEAVLSVYGNMVKAYSGCSRDKWISGVYDNMYSFPDNDSYDTFNRLFYSGFIFRPTTFNYRNTYSENVDNAYGYAEKDLNGDGTEELVLMVDRFDIIAIFTMKDGKAVLLDSYIPKRRCLIDENGLIRVKAEVGIDDARDSEYYLYNVSDGELECQFGIGCTFNIYLKPDKCYKIEQGEKTPISDDEWNELYSRYDIFPDDMSESEYIKTFAGLEFIHLFEQLKLDKDYKGRIYEISPGNEECVSLSMNGRHFMLQMDYYKYSKSRDRLIYKTVISAQLEDMGDYYEFHTDTVSGIFELGVANVWVTITESKDELIDCGVYHFEYLAGVSY